MSRNLLGIRHLSLDEIGELIKIATDFKMRVIEDKPVPDLKKYVLGLLFFEDSTRRIMIWFTPKILILVKDKIFAFFGA